MKEWVRMPSYWIRDKTKFPLVEMKWQGANKADQIAALMLYIVLVHHANDEIAKDLPDVGLCKITYSELSDITGLSRSKISGGLNILYDLGVVSKFGSGRNNIYKIKNYGSHSGWAKLPAKGLYSKDYQKIHAFHRFNLRLKNELNAMKIYLLIIALRDNSTNYAKIGYNRINEYTGIPRNNIRTALSLLVNLGLIHVDSGNSDINEFSTINMYRLAYLEVYKHRGTTVREI